MITIPLCGSFRLKGLSTARNVFQTLRSSLGMVTESRIDEIEKLSIKCVTMSKATFNDGSKFVNQKDQMGTWIDQDLLADVISSLNKTELNEESPLYKSVQGSVIPMKVNLFRHDGVELNLFHIPRNHTLPPRTHTAGTILVYMVVHIYIPFYFLFISLCVSHRLFQILLPAVPCDHI